MSELPPNDYQNPPASVGPADYQPAPPAGPPAWLGITSLVLGIVGLFAACLPICGCPVNITGIVFGVLGMKSSARTMALVGLGLSIFGMLLTLLSAAYGVYASQHGGGIKF
jgi:hypothetical protein